MNYLKELVCRLSSEYITERLIKMIMKAGSSLRLMI